MDGSNNNNDNMCINQTITAPLQSEQVLQDNESATVTPTLPPAKLVRGFTGTGRDDFDAQAALVASALPGWCDVDRDSILVEDKSGHGGSKTFKVSAPTAQPPAVALHSRNVIEAGGKGVSGDGAVSTSSEERQETAATAFALGGCAPRRLAQGGDWFIECWEGEQPWNEREGGWDSLTTQELADAAALLAKVHSDVPTEWFDLHRKKIIEQNPSFEGCPTGSHAWLTASRLRWFEGETDSDPEHLAEAVQFYLNAGCGPETVDCLHPLGARIVTNHGDFHPSNFILGATGLACVDLEFAHVSRAVHDLAYCFMWLKGAEKRRLFIAAYMTACGEGTPTAEEVNALWFDAECAESRVFHPAALWGDFFKSKDDIDYMFDKYKLFAAAEQRVRQCPDLRDEALQTGLKQCPAFVAVELEWSQKAREENEWMNAEQAALQDETCSANESVECDEALKGTEFCIPVCSDSDLVLQVRPGSSLIELAAFEADKKQQQWYRVGECLQHAASGLFLDTEVKYVVNTRKRSWESSPTRLCVSMQDHSDRQRWCLDSTDAGKCAVRHVIDGRVLTVNSWKVEIGQGVHVGVECKIGRTAQQWQIMDVAVPPPQSAALESATATVLDCTDDTEYIIQCSHPTEASDDTLVHGTQFCIQVTDHIVNCGMVNGDQHQRWKLVGQDGAMQIINVGNGECLHTETKYITIHDQSHVWDDNGTDLVTKPADLSEQQKWLFGFGGPTQEQWAHKHKVAVEAWGDDDLTLSAGKCLRHFKDGRVVDVHDWRFKDGGKMGCENSCHAENKGTSWILVDAASL